MKIETDVIKSNFFALLRLGAFNERQSVMRMSPFKWHRLLQMAEVQNVVGYFCDGLRRANEHGELQLPPHINIPTPSHITSRQNGGEIALSNHWLNSRLQKIYKNERHCIDASVDTLRLLTIIVNNVNHTLNHGISLKGIITLGLYLRNNGQKVDFVKLEKWLHHIHLERMAQLQASILTDAFGFEIDELPFIEREDPNVHNLLMRAISNTEKDTAEQWHFRQTRTGFVANNSSVLRLNLRRSLRYINYARLETASNFVHNFARSLSEIEE